MASDRASGGAESTSNLQVDVEFSHEKQITEEVETRVESLLEKISLCNTILKDLKELNDILVKKSLQDASLQKHK